MKHKFTIAVFLLVCNFSKATNYEVGPGKQYTSIGEVPTHNLQAGDTVKVFYKATPYFEKFLLAGVGTATQPILFIGIPDGSGNKPIIDGENAVTSPFYNFYNADRQIIKVGQDTPSDYITIDGFVFRNANNTKTYQDFNGNTQSYLQNACAVRPEMCTNITIRNCEINNCGNGLMGGAAPQIFTMESCYIHDNGLSTNLNSSFQHNIYAGGGAGTVLIVQYCRFGESQCDGQNLKSRSETNIIRYNWIEGGKNGQIDLVDDENGPANSYVYGNIIIKPATGNNGRMIMWGQDNGDDQTAILYFYNNTCIHNLKKGRFFDLNTPGRTLVADNNIFYSTINVKFGNILSSYSGSHNWLSLSVHGFNSLTTSITGKDPGFANASLPDFHLKAGSSCIDVVSNYITPTGFPLDKEYVSHLSYKSRALVNGLLDIGAYEYCNSGNKSLLASTVSFTNKKISEKAILDVVPNTDITVFPNPTTDVIFIRTKNKTGPVTLQVYNSAGRLIIEKVINANGTINISSLPDGVYIIKTGYHSKTMRIIKMGK